MTIRRRVEYTCQQYEKKKKPVVPVLGKALAA